MGSFSGKEADGQYGSFLFGYFDGKLSESMESAPSFFIPVKEKTQDLVQKILRKNDIWWFEMKCIFCRNCHWNFDRNRL